MEFIKEELVSVHKTAGLDLGPMAEHIQTWLETGKLHPTLATWLVAHTQELNSNRVQAELMAALVRMVLIPESPQARYRAMRALVVLLVPLLPLREIVQTWCGFLNPNHQEKDRILKDIKWFSDHCEFSEFYQELHPYYLDHNNIPMWQNHYQEMIRYGICESLVEGILPVNAWWNSVYHCEGGSEMATAQSAPGMGLRIIEREFRMLGGNRPLLLEFLSQAPDSVLAELPRYEGFFKLLGHDTEVRQAFVHAAGVHTGRLVSSYIQLEYFTSNPQAWIDLVKMAVAHGHVPRDTLKHAQAKKWLREELASNKDARSRIRLIYLLRKDLSESEIVSRLLTDMPKAGTESDNFGLLYGLYSGNWQYLFDCLSSVDVVLSLLEIDHPVVRRHCLQRYFKVAPGSATDPRVIALVQKDTNGVSTAMHEASGKIDNPLLLALWRKSGENSGAVSHFLSDFKRFPGVDYRGDRNEFLNEIFADKVDRVASYFKDAARGLSISELEALWQLENLHIQNVMLDLMLRWRIENKELLSRKKVLQRFQTALQMVALSNPERLAAVTAQSLGPLLGNLDASETLEALSGALKQRLSASNNATQRRAIVEFLSRAAVPLLQADQWLDTGSPSYSLAIAALSQRGDADALEVLAEHFNNIEDQTLKDEILDKLESAGKDVENLVTKAEMTPVQLLAEAKKQLPKKLPIAIAKLCDDEFYKILKPLKPEIGQWLLLQLSQGESQVPRTARLIFDQLSEVQHHLLTELLMNRWLAENGSPKLKWVLQLIPQYGDDRIVATLLQAIKLWNKRVKPKANEAIRNLGALGTTFALASVRDILESGKYSDSLEQAASDVLKAVAKERGMELRELYEELTPDLGLEHEGLRLDTGPRTHLLKLAPDLSIKIINEETGKVSKSLPKARADEDADKRQAAEAQLKLFKKNLKPVAKQLQTRLQLALVSGQGWQRERWLTLHLEHRLLRVLAQGQVWLISGNGGTPPRSFRISEDYSLIDCNSEEVTLPEGCTITLWHPAEAEEADIIAWREHMADYEIQPLFEQVNLPVHTLKDEEKSQTEITRFEGYAMIQGSIVSALSKLSYQRSSSGDQYIEEHVLPLKEANLTIVVSHTPITAWMEVERPVAIRSIGVFKRSNNNHAAGSTPFLALDDLPNRVVSTMIEHLNQLSAKSSGFDASWKNW